MRSSTVHVMEQRPSFFLSPVADRYSAARSEWVTWFRSAFLLGFKDISRVCVPQLSSMAAIVCPRSVLSHPFPGTNPRLFWTREHKQCGQPTLHSCTLPLTGLWVLHWYRFLQDKQHSVQLRVDKHVSHVPILDSLYRKLGSHVARAVVCDIRARSPTYSRFLSGWVQIKASHFYVFTSLEISWVTVLSEWATFRAARVQKFPLAFISGGKPVCKRWVILMKDITFSTNASFWISKCTKQATSQKVVTVQPKFSLHLQVTFYHD